MTLTNSEGQERNLVPTLDDPLQHLQGVSPHRSPSLTGLASATDAARAPKRAPWLSELQRLKPLEADLALLPVGWGADRKGPMLTRWPEHPGFSIAELQAFKRMRSVGARTGLHTGPLLCFDFDGRTALELALRLDMAPPATVTWQVHRNNDPYRLKVLFRPTADQVSQLQAEFQAKTITASGSETQKGEALEVFFDGGRQVIVLGEHPSSGGSYIWPAQLGPKALAPPPEPWWRYAREMASANLLRKSSSSKARSRRQGSTHRLNPCPTCGRHNGMGGSGLWCGQTSEGLIFCMPGSTFSAERKHGRLRIGAVIDGWALVGRSRIAEGDVLIFKAHQERRASIRPCRRWRHG